MRFAWLRSRQGLDKAPDLGSGGRVTLVVYNAIWWLPIVFAILGVMSYKDASVSFLAITVFRAAANLYRNNVLSIEAGQRFLLRSP